MGVSWTLCNLAYCLLRTESLSEAFAVARESLGFARLIDDTQVITWDLLLLAAIAMRTGHVDHALRLNTAVEGVRATTGLQFSGTEAALHQETGRELSGAIGHEAYAAALDEADGLPISDIVDYALEVRL